MLSRAVQSLSVHLHGLICVAAALAILSTSALPARAERAYVAAAANFAEVLEALQPIFKSGTGHELIVTIGSTGKLYAQIVNGAPFEVLLAADQARPERLVAEGHAVGGSRFTYAIGLLVLWSPDAGRIADDPAAALRAPDVSAIAIANPALAPYGFAARQALEKMGLWSELSSKIAMGENIGQTFSMVASGNAQLGFVAKSYALSPRNSVRGSLWSVSTQYYDPIRQDAVLLKKGSSNKAAKAFMEFLRKPEARAVIEKYGYAIE
ncbi:MAG: molybdate ABC transporter substrate-binding protein [Alphaproteobacteria bacterium]|nr:molybdate ABC transporter substrate-binding protein [Alphaproteobacteria bacterium]